ncbi:hypothetical protein TWF481_003736 [Arthrobotrys musiformis]|uniref:Uncharacterized protein n=1 Tax=Arthrobotrys musiformis TaxID=47236 RepID=A0AAV9WHE1_9PEZI
MEEIQSWSRCKVKSVAFTGLKEFSGAGPLFPGRGPSFADCVLAANEGLNGKHDFIVKRDGDPLPGVVKWTEGCHLGQFAPAQRGQGLDSYTMPFGEDLLKSFRDRMMFEFEAEPETASLDAFRMSGMYGRSEEGDEDDEDDESEESGSDSDGY